MKIIPPELVSPAGDWTSLLTAVENGADSVYFGIQGLNMRNLAGNFQVSELKKIMHYLHRHHKKGYLALNVIVYDQDIRQVERILKAAKAAQVDAVILWDMAVMSLAKKIGLRVHLSTQASVANSAALKFYHSLSVRRVVLARECTLADIRQITRTLKRGRIKCEIETFVHGAMCVSISGRCFLSQEAFGKSANRGECHQPCRREYLIREADGDNEYLLGQDYVLSPKDLCAIELVDDLIRAGVRSFKIEGRMRSPEYIKVVTRAYRRAIDAFANGKLTDQLKQEFKAELASVYNRGFSTGFFFGTPAPEVSRKLEHTIKTVSYTHLTLPTIYSV